MDFVNEADGTDRLSWRNVSVESIITPEENVCREASHQCYSASVTKIKSCVQSGRSR